MSSKELGALGERLACEYLIGKGYEILDKNYSARSGKNRIFGEIDIIARKKINLFKFISSFANSMELANRKTIHFVEVKTSQTLQGLTLQELRGFFPEERADYKKRKKLKRLCQIWLNERGLPQNFPHQIDVIGILADATTKKARVHFFPNVVSDN